MYASWNFREGIPLPDRLASGKILSVAGTPVAGDALDREIIRANCFLFGSRARYGPSKLPMPQHIYNQILDWQNIYKLNTEETINWLMAAESSTNYPEGIRALRCLIRRNYGYLVAREVETAKKRLSQTDSTHITINREDITIDELLEREEFAHIVEFILERMFASIVEAEKRAGIKAKSLDFVLTTGGTCLVPAVQDMLKKRFGDKKLRSRDTFTSVATGLAVVAQHAF